jgi:hypothetical protein
MSVITRRLGIVFAGLALLGVFGCAENNEDLATQGGGAAKSPGGGAGNYGKMAPKPGDNTAQLKDQYKQGRTSGEDAGKGDTSK